MTNSDDEQSEVEQNIRKLEKAQVRCRNLAIVLAIATIAMCAVWVVFLKRNASIEKDSEASQKLLDQLKANFSTPRSVQYNYAGISNFEISTTEPIADPSRWNIDLSNNLLTAISLWSLAESPIINLSNNDSNADNNLIENITLCIFNATKTIQLKGNRLNKMELNNFGGSLQLLDLCKHFNYSSR